MGHRHAGALGWPWSFSKGRTRKRQGSAGGDGLLLGVVVILSLAGLVVVFSGSGVLALHTYHDPLYFLKRQALWLVIGFLGLHLVSRLHYTHWQHLSLPLLGGTIVLLGLVLFPSIGVVGNGARRWLQVGPGTFQPAELAKVAVVVYVANYLSKKEGILHRFWTGFLPPLLVMGLVCALILPQPDLGSVCIIGLVTGTLLYLGGARVRHLAGLVLAVVPVVFALIWQSEYRRKRLLIFLRPWEDPQGAGFQLVQSFIAFGSGGLFGVGLGEGKQKLLFLPEAHTDFVLAVVGEELGLLGAAALMVLYVALMWRGMRIAARAQKSFGRHLAYGVTLLIGFQGLLNAAVVTGLLPTKGMTLPLVSYGGSSLVTTLLAVGMLLNVSRDRQGGGSSGKHGRR